MSAVEINYKGNKIAEMNTAGTKTCKTAGKYCEGDITVTYSGSSIPSITVTTAYAAGNRVKTYFDGLPYTNAVFVLKKNGTLPNNQVVCVAKSTSCQSGARIRSNSIDSFSFTTQYDAVINVGDVFYVYQF